jgi:transcriptional antiterminator RfaH
VQVHDSEAVRAYAPEQRWYVLHTKRFKELEVVERVGRLGVEAYCPRIRMPLAQGRSRYISASFFPGYVFVHAHYLRAYHALRWLPGVSSWLQFGDRPAYLEEDIVQRLRSQEDRKGYIRLRPPRLQPGDRVQILEGAFRGVEGLFDGYLSPESRVRVLLNLVSYTVRVEIGLESVKKLSA